MSLWDKLAGEFIDIIEWTDDSRDTMVSRFERHGNEIKFGAKLTVRESQIAVFVNEGRIADVFEPGMYELKTENLPILSTLQGWKYGFESPFKAEVYFVNSRQFLDLKWGTSNPVMLRDPEFGAVRLRAFGTYAIRIAEPGKFITEVVGTDGHFTIDEVTDQLRNLIVSRLSTLMAQSGIPVLDLASNYTQLSEFLTKAIAPEFKDYGLEIPTMLVENISLPAAVEEAMDKRTSMGVIGDLTKYAQFQAADAMSKAAENPGAAGDAMGMGVGLLLANQFGGFGHAAPGAQPPAQPASGGGAPPPLPGQNPFFIGVNGQQTGPFQIDQLPGQVAAGQLTPESLVWQEGMDGWKKAGEVAALAGLFQAAGGATPPPLPPG